MKNGEEAHKITEQIYKNLNEKFIPNMKQVSLCARSFYKALSNVTVAARSYSEALFKLGKTAESITTGPTREIGSALHEIAEVYKQLEIQTEEKMKSLMNDIAFPLENKLDSEFKNMATTFKKYNQEHKAIVIPFEKAQNTLSKIQKKKSRSKFSDKEAQYAQTISKAQMKLYDHRIAGLQKALTEEWKSHCFLLECVCNMLTLDHHHYAKLQRMIAPNIERWTHYYSITEGSIPDVNDFKINGTYLQSSYTDTQNNDMMKMEPIYNDTNVPSSYPIQTGPDNSESIFTKQRPLATGSLQYSRKLDKFPPTEKVSSIYVQAMHRHEATSETQLSFQEGDSIKLIGEKSEGWHYGYNINDHKYGWFPLSFTVPISPPLELLQKMSLHDDQPITARVKSTSDLLHSNDNHVNIPPRRSSITNSLNEGSNSMQGLAQIADSQNSLPLSHSYQTSTNKIPTPPPQPQPLPQPQPSLYSYPSRPPYSPTSTSNLPQFSASSDNEYQNLSSLQPNNNFEMPPKRMNSSPPLPPPPSRHSETDYGESDYRYYTRNDV
ncbi:brain-specific angiogenesis inhibitor 1-associated protein 2-like [Argonauta hians]